MTWAPQRLTPALQKRLQSELAAGERLLYAACPDWRTEALRHSISFVFGLGWMAICGPMALLVWAEAAGLVVPGFKTGGMGQGMALFFSIFMLPFLLVGLVMLATPVFAALSAKRSVHAITDARLLTVDASRRGPEQSIKLAAVNFVRRVDGRDGFGTLTFGYGVEADSDGDPRPLTVTWAGVPQVRRAEELLRTTAQWVRTSS